MKIVVLKEEHIKKVFTMKEAIRAAGDALAACSGGRSDVPLRVNIDVPEHAGQSLYMPGYASDSKALGVKIVSVYPRNVDKGLPSVPACMVLVDAETGEVCSILDGTFLTRLRTGAVSGAATELLARKDARTMALFGTGGQAATQLESVLNVRDIELVKVFDTATDRAKDFAGRMTEKFSGTFRARIVAASSAEEAIRDADVVTAVTTSNDPVFDGRLLKKGAHVNGVGSYTPAMSEIDEHVVCGAKVYVDTRNGAFNECGNLIKPIKKGLFDEKKIAGELGELILGKIAGRASEEELTLFCTVGTAALDVVTARRIYEKALEKGIGESVEF